MTVYVFKLNYVLFLQKGSRVLNAISHTPTDKVLVDIETYIKGDVNNASS